MTKDNKCKIAENIIKYDLLQEYRITDDSPFQGMIIYCRWDEREEVRDTIYDSLKEHYKIGRK